jgi:transporter family protein
MGRREVGMTWWAWALVSAGAAALVSILAKLGMQDIPSNLATAIRTVVILVFAWALVLLRGEAGHLGQISRRGLLFLVLSGLATGISWLAYFRALQLGPASRVAPIDKLSLVFIALLGCTLLRETFSLRYGLGLALVMAGVLLTTLG